MRATIEANLETAGTGARETLHRWKQYHDELVERLNAKQRELEAEGLTVEVGAVRAIADRLGPARSKLAGLKQRQNERRTHIRQRRTLVDQLESNRGAIYERRRATMRRVVRAANEASAGLIIHLIYTRAGDLADWARRLGSMFRFRAPRVQRIAEILTPRQLAGAIRGGPDAVLELADNDGERIFDHAMINEAWPTVHTRNCLFDLDTIRIEDRVRIEVQEPGSSDCRPFDHLSAGQQRSVLLGLILCADRHDPLVLDQPEDHLDAEYIASAIVHHLELAKERRQVILATHSANLTVLGDAELVVPMYAANRHGQPRDPGAVDRPATRHHVCALLEGGADAYRRRGERYGFTITQSR